jgi:hypothetical protein
VYDTKIKVEHTSIILKEGQPFQTGMEKHAWISSTLYLKTVYLNETAIGESTFMEEINA